MTEQELVAKIQEIQSDHFKRMNRDLAPYLKQLKVFTDARLSADNQVLDEQYRGGWANHKPEPNAGIRAMTPEEADAYLRRHPSPPREPWEEPRRGVIGNLFGLPIPF